jgi:hypothetical protein
MATEKPWISWVFVTPPLPLVAARGGGFRGERNKFRSHPEERGDTKEERGDTKEEDAIWMLMVARSRTRTVRERHHQ